MKCAFHSDHSLDLFVFADFFDVNYGGEDKPGDSVDLREVLFKVVESIE